MDRLPVGTVVDAEVVGHRSWGVTVRLRSHAVGRVGTIDVMYITNTRPFTPFADYPPIGSIVRAVVMYYPPNGELRLSTRDSDLT